MKSNAGDLSVMLRVGAACVAVICIESIACFLIGKPEAALLNPFAALLFLVASPFFYWMGKIAGRNGK